MNTAIPQEWLDVLSEVQAIFHGAVIAGGALRDLYNDKPIKDVDIFIPVDGLSLESDYEDIWDMFAGEDITSDKSSVYGVKSAEEGRDLYAIFRLVKPDCKYDLIVCTHNACKIETFDINICQLCHDGVQLHTTPAYHEAVQTKTLKVMNINRTDRNKARLDRLLQKYTDFKVEEA